MSAHHSVETNQSSQPASRLPYDFVPVDIAKSVTDEPVWHDGMRSGDLLFGEIRCGLEALTPLLPGNFRYAAEDADPARRDAWTGEQLAEQIAEPLRLPDGRVLIAGTAIKGMLRHSLGALLSAPMERVDERHFTYRPNLAHAGDHPRLECRPAIVKGISKNAIDVLVLPAQSAVFIHHNVVLNELERLAPGQRLTQRFEHAILDVHPKTNQKRIRFRHNHHLEIDHYFFHYIGGIDGKGLLAAAFSHGGKVHREALIPIDDVDREGIKKKITETVIGQYQLTQQRLADNQIGHLTKSHPLNKTLDKKLGAKGVEKVAQAIATAAILNLEQLIFVEVEVGSNGLGAITSFGHHYQYRWAYTASVRELAGRPRDCLTALQTEHVNGESSSAENIAPTRLSGARLLFGYVRDDKTLRIGTGVFSRLAGRISINHAISLKSPEFYLIPAPTMSAYAPVCHWAVKRCRE